VAGEYAIVLNTLVWSHVGYLPSSDPPITVSEMFKLYFQPSNLGSNPVVVNVVNPRPYPDFEALSLGGIDKADDVDYANPTFLNCVGNWTWSGGNVSKFDQSNTSVFHAVNTSLNARLYLGNTTCSSPQPGYTKWFGSCSGGQGPKRLTAVKEKFRSH